MAKGLNVILRSVAPRASIQQPYALTRSLELLNRKQLRGLVQDLQAQLDARACPALVANQISTERWTLLDAGNLVTTNEDAAVAATDNATGITWLLASSDKHYRNDGPAGAYVKGLATLGYTDWRLPTEPELLNGPRDITAYQPAVHKPFRKGVKPEAHWSSSPDPESAVYARYVSFDDGNSNILRRNGGFRVLACRGGLGAVGGVSPGQ